MHVWLSFARAAEAIFARYSNIDYWRQLPFLTHDGYDWGAEPGCVCGKDLHTSIVPSWPLRLLSMAPQILFLCVNSKKINHIIITFIQVEMSFGHKFHALVVFPGCGRVQPERFRVFLPYLCSAVTASPSSLVSRLR